MVGDAEQRALERENAVAVAARSFREQDQRVLGGEPAGDAVALLGRAAHPAVDEHRALQFRQPAEQRPARHLGLGDERGGEQRAQHGDVEIGDVVGGEQHRADGDRPADRAHPQAEDAAAAPVVPAREGGDPGPPQQQTRPPAPASAARSTRDISPAATPAAPATRGLSRRPCLFRLPLVMARVFLGDEVGLDARCTRRWC